MNIKNIVRAGAVATVFVAGSVLAQTTSLTSLITVTPQVQRGTADAPLATLLLDASNSGEDVRITSVPFTISSQNGSASHLTNCSVSNLNDFNDPLNTGANAIGTAGSTNLIEFDTPIVIAEGSSRTLVFTCDISSTVQPGVVYSIGVNPADIEAEDAFNDDAITVTGSVGSNGIIRPTSGNMMITATEVIGGPVVPGVPNTGAGGESVPTWIALILSGVVALLGAAYVLRRGLA